MAVAIAEVAKPAAAGPRFEHHGHGLVVAHFVVGSELLEQRGEGGVERGADANFLSDVQRQIVQHAWCG